MDPDQKVMNGRDEVTVAVVQSAPVFLDKEATIDKACQKIEEAGRQGAELVVFPEAWIAGYPYWGEGWESELGNWIPVRTQFYDNSIVVPSDDTDVLADAASSADTHVVMGCNEMDPRAESQTIYNTMLYLGRDGEVLGRHRKIMPTFVERAVWGNGDGSDLGYVETDIGRITGLVCGEHLMTPVRAHMARQGADFHVALFPGAFSLQKGPKLEEADKEGSEFWGHTLARSHALEAGTFVLSGCGYITEEDIPDSFPMDDTLNVDYAHGGSQIVSPLGTPLAGPESGDTIVYSTCESEMVKVWKAIIDTAGHYARPDVVDVDYHATPYQSVENAVENTSRAELERVADRHGTEPEAMQRGVESVTSKPAEED